MPHIFRMLPLGLCISLGECPHCYEWKLASSLAKMLSVAAISVILIRPERGLCRLSCGVYAYNRPPSALYSSSANHVRVDRLWGAIVADTRVEHGLRLRPICLGHRPTGNIHSGYTVT